MPEDLSDNDDDGKTRWLIVGFVACLFLGLGVLGWQFRSTDKPAPICSNPEAHCGDKTDGNAQ